jgi:hypothetical protein
VAAITGRRTSINQKSRAGKPVRLFCVHAMMANRSGDHRSPLYEKTYEPEIRS